MHWRATDQLVTELRGEAVKEAALVYEKVEKLYRAVKLELIMQLDGAVVLVKRGLENVHRRLVTEAAKEMPPNHRRASGE